MINWITGEKFVGIADFVFSLNKKEDCNKMNNTFDVNTLHDKAIIYTNTMYVHDLFNILSNVTSKRIILVSHNSDTNIDETYHIPDSVEKWFTMNVAFIHPKIETIPLGLENDKWFPSIHKKDMMLKKLKEKKNISNLVYVNFDEKTNFERASVLCYFKDECSCWVTVKKGKNGQDFSEYINDIYNHMFVICPEGNGIDTVRLWEALYMQSIPVVKWRPCWNVFLDMPILFVDDFTGLKEEFFVKEYIKIKSKKYNYSKLNFDYWKNKIQNYDWKD